MSGHIERGEADSGGVELPARAGTTATGYRGVVLSGERRPAGGAVRQYQDWRGASALWGGLKGKVMEALIGDIE